MYHFFKTSVSKDLNLVHPRTQTTKALENFSLLVFSIFMTTSANGNESDRTENTVEDEHVINQELKYSSLYNEQPQGNIRVI